MERSHVPIFTGNTDGVDLDSWIGWMEEYFAWNGIFIENEKLDMGWGFIHDEALEWLINWERRTQNFATWDSLKQALGWFHFGSTVATAVTRDVQRCLKEFRIEMTRSFDNQRAKLSAGLENIHQMRKLLREEEVRRCAPDPTMMPSSVTTFEEHVSQQEILLAEEPLTEAFSSDTSTKFVSHKENLVQKIDFIEAVQPHVSFVVDDEDLKTHIQVSPSLEHGFQFLGVLENKDDVLVLNASQEAILQVSHVNESPDLSLNWTSRRVPKIAHQLFVSKLLWVKRQRRQGKLLKSWKYKFKSKVKAETKTSRVYHLLAEVAVRDSRENTMCEVKSSAPTWCYRKKPFLETISGQKGMEAGLSMMWSMQAGTRELMWEEAFIPLHDEKGLQSIEDVCTLHILSLTTEADKPLIETCNNFVHQWPTYVEQLWLKQSEQVYICQPKQFPLGDESGRVVELESYMWSSDDTIRAIMVFSMRDKHSVFLVWHRWRNRNFDCLRHLSQQSLPHTDDYGGGDHYTWTKSFGGQCTLGVHVLLFHRVITTYLNSFLPHLTLLSLHAKRVPQRVRKICFQSWIFKKKLAGYIGELADNKWFDENKHFSLLATYMETVHVYVVAVLSCSYKLAAVAHFSYAVDSLLYHWLVATSECVVAYDQHRDTKKALAIGRKTYMLASSGKDVVRQGNALQKEGVDLVGQVKLQRVQVLLLLVEWLQLQGKLSQLSVSVAKESTSHIITLICSATGWSLTTRIAFEKIDPLPKKLLMACIIVGGMFQTQNNQALAHLPRNLRHEIGKKNYLWEHGHGGNTNLQLVWEWRFLKDWMFKFKYKNRACGQALKKEGSIDRFLKVKDGILSHSIT